MPKLACRYDFGQGCLPMQKSPAHVLLVDDDPQVAECVSEQLQSLGAKVTVAPDAVTAAERLHNLRFDVALIDLNLGGGDSGVTVCEIARQTDPHLPLVLATGFATETDLHMMRRIGFFSLLQKPYGILQLKLMLRQFRLLLPD